MPKAAKRTRRKPQPPPFESVSPALEGIALKWSLAYGYHFDDLFDVVQMVYMEVAADYDGYYDFAGWLKYKVWMALKDYRRREIRRRQIVKNLGTVCNHEDQQSDFEKTNAFAVEVSYFSLDDFVGGLKSDAAEVVGLVFDSPRDLVRLMRQQGGNRGEFCRHRGRSQGGYEAGVCLRKYLRDTRGWTRRKIDKSFSEIREALA